MASPETGKPRETGKQRATRIPLDYYKQADPITRWKLGLSLVALVGALGWWAVGLAGSGAAGRLSYTHGPVARVHAAWDADCAACHVDFAPISGSASWTRSVGLDAKAGDAKCKTCHTGPPHAASQK